MSDSRLTTPMMEQYLRIKKQYQDAILLFRLGDFYEMFYEDAKIASPILEIALTSRQKVPMCGVPYHAVNSYLAKLLKQGFKVAICEQVEDPKTARGVVRRDVVKVLTPGTAVEVDIEGTKENLYIAGVVLRENGWGLALVDLASGHLRLTEGTRSEEKRLADEIFHAAPKEVVYPETEDSRLRRIIVEHDLAPFLLSPTEDWHFDTPGAEDLLLRHFGVASLAGFGLEGRPYAVSAGGGLLHYLKTIRKNALALIRQISFFQSSDRMILDATTVRNLELIRNLRDGRVKDSLLDVIDMTVTPMGARLLRGWLLEPLLDLRAIVARQDSVEEWRSRLVERQRLRDLLKEIPDLERLTGKVGLGAAHPRDLIALKRALFPLPAIRNLLEKSEVTLTAGLFSTWDSAEDIVALIDRAILDEPAFLLSEGGIIREGFSPELDELRRISLSGKSYISQLERRERERTGISSLKVRHNRVFGYYIEVTKPNLHLVPPDYIRKQTLLGAERFLTPELKEYEEKVLTAEERIAAIEEKLFLEVRGTIARQTERLQKISRALAQLDVLSSLAELAAQRNYCRPVVDDQDRILIVDGRHAVIEKTLAEPFIPNDTRLDREENQILIITGPNMGGKSTYLRQVALITILAQIGSFVPASRAEIGLVDRIFTRIGAMDFLNVGQSTFMVEMLETANILNNATPRSLILLDEVGRGTSTFDGLSIAWAVAEFLHEKDDVRARTLFATHYHELTDLARTHPRIKNFHVAVRAQNETIVFLRKIEPGPSDESYGIQVARLAGLPATVLDRAREVLANLEKLELDEAGLPRIAYRTRRWRDRSQLLLFQEDREQEKLRDLWQDIEQTDVMSLTPLEALTFLHRLKEKMKNR